MDKRAVVHIHMEYHSVIKKNAFESALIRWMKLEPIIQSELSQKEKHQYIYYCLYMEFRKMITMTLSVRQEETQIQRTHFWTLWEKARVG